MNQLSINQGHQDAFPIVSFQATVTRIGDQYFVPVDQLNKLLPSAEEEPARSEWLPRLLLRLDEVGQMLGISRWAVQKRIKSGEIPAIRIGTTTRVAFEDLRAWIEQRASYASERGRHN